MTVVYVGSRPLAVPSTSPVPGVVEFAGVDARPGAGADNHMPDVCQVYKVDDIDDACARNPHRIGEAERADKTDKCRVLDRARGRLTDMSEAPSVNR